MSNIQENKQELFTNVKKNCEKYGIELGKSSERQLRYGNLRTQFSQPGRKQTPTLAQVAFALSLH